MFVSQLCLSFLLYVETIFCLVLENLNSVL